MDEDRLPILAWKINSRVNQRMESGFLGWQSTIFLNYWNKTSQ